MGVGRIQLWVPSIYDPCAIDPTSTYVATVQRCSGKVLDWPGGRYQTKDGQWHPILGAQFGLNPGKPGFYDGVPGTGDPGHVYFEVPPGCYVVSASWHVWKGPAPGGQNVLYGNQATHKTIVCVCCDKDACVTLFQPTGWHCSVIQVQELLMQVLAGNNVIKREEQAAFVRAMEPLLKVLNPSEFDKNDLEVARTIAKRLTSKDIKAGKKGKKK
jgi:hypothetical protein